MADLPASPATSSPGDSTADLALQNESHLFIHGYREWTVMDIRNGEYKTFEPPTFGFPIVSSNGCHLISTSDHARGVYLINGLLRWNQENTKQLRLELSALWEPQKTHRLDLKSTSPRNWSPVVAENHIERIITTRANLFRQLQEYRRDAWIPIVDPGDSKPTASKFGGVAAIPAGEEWPVCGNCSRAMDLLLQLNSGQVPDFGVRGFPGILQVFTCLQDDDFECNHWDAFSAGSLVRIIEHSEYLGICVSPVENPLFLFKLLDWRRIDDYPTRDELELAASVRIEEKPSGAIDLFSHTFSDDKLGGWACWEQDTGYPKCPNCLDPMEYILQLRGEPISGYIFGDGGVGHVFQCPLHPR
jgi:hypothetical protein